MFEDSGACHISPDMESMRMMGARGRGISWVGGKCWNKHRCLAIADNVLTILHNVHIGSK